MLIVPVIAIPIFVKMVLYRAIIRYLPEKAIWTIFRAVTIAAGPERNFGGKTTP